MSLASMTHPFLPSLIIFSIVLYKNVLDISVRNFIRSLLKNSLNLDVSVFKNYQEIADFVNSFDGGSIKINPNIISQLKRRSAKPKKLYRDSISEAFVDFVSLKFPNFDSEKFFNEFSEKEFSEKN